MTYRWMITFLVIAAVGCSDPAKEKQPPPPVAELSAEEVIAIERTPGSTPPLEDATEPPPAVVAGIEGTPGPSPAYGPIDAPVRVYILTDFQCPVCRRSVEPIKYLARRYPKDVRIVVKHNAITGHGRAAAAAAAGIAAFRQGKFWAYYDRVFESSGPYDDAALVTHAQAVGLDAERFKKDMTDPAVAAQVKYESALATTLEVNGTPGLVVNGTPQIGWSSYIGLKGMVDRALSRAKQVAANGTPANRVAYESTRQAGAKGERFAAGLFPVVAK